MRPRSCSDLRIAPQFTPRISSTSARPIGWRYAMMASVSSAAADNRAGRLASCARSIASVYSARVRICHPPPVSISSTPWPASSYCVRSSVSAPATSSSVASESSVARSPIEMGDELANSAASSSFASGLTLDLHVGKGPVLPQLHFAALRHLQQSEQDRKDLPRLGSRAYEIAPAAAAPEREDVAHDGDRAFDV